MKRMKNIVIATIDKLKGELRALQLQDKTVGEFLRPLMSSPTPPPNQLEGIEVKEKQGKEGDVSMILRVENTTRACVRTLNRTNIADKITDLHDLDIVVRQSRSSYASLIQETPAFKNEPVISRMIADFLYFRLIPIEIYLPDETSIACQPPHFPVTWTIARVLDAQLPEWEKRYFHNINGALPPLSSNPHLVALNDFYLQAMVRGEKTFDFKLEETLNAVKADVNPHNLSNTDNWNTAFPYFSKEDERFFELNNSLMLTAAIPDAGLERLVDSYVRRIKDQFPFRALYVSATGVNRYRNLCMRIEENGRYHGTLNMLQRGHSWTGDRKLSACQYVVQSNQLEIFHKHKPPPLVSQCLEDPSILEEVSNLYPDTTGKAIQSMKDRQIWEPICANLTGSDGVDEEEVLTWDSTSATMQSMFEIYAYYGLNYIGYPIRSEKGHPLGVVCLLHENDHSTAEQWEALSDIKTLASEVQTLFHKINYKVPRNRQVVRSGKKRK